PMFQPFRLGGLELANRVIVSPMDMYSARDGVPGDFHLVHLGSKALGGAGLVMTEMVCVSPTGRITPGCTGLYNAEQENSWRRVVDFVHDRSGAKIGIQLGHSGRKGSTRLMWEGMDDPLPEGNWEVCCPSPLPYKAGAQVPRSLDEAELCAIRDQFVAAAQAAARAGFDLLELHCAHGYLLSSFLSPLTNQRTDQSGGSRAGPTCARSAAPTCTTRSGPCTPPPSRGTPAPARPGRCRSPRAAAGRRGDARTARGRGWS